MYLFTMILWWKYYEGLNDTFIGIDKEILKGYFD